MLQSLPMLEGWVHKWHYINNEPIQRGKYRIFCEYKDQKGWLWGITIGSLSSPMYELEIKSDDEILKATPYQTYAYGFYYPDTYIWTPKEAYEAGNYILSFHPDFYLPFKSNSSVTVIAPSDADIVVNGLVTVILITDEKKFLESYRRLHAPIPIP